MYEKGEIPIRGLLWNWSMFRSATLMMNLYVIVVKLVYYIRMVHAIHERDYKVFDDLPVHPFVVTALRKGLANENKVQMCDLMVSIYFDLVLLVALCVSSRNIMALYISVNYYHGLVYAWKGYQLYMPIAIGGGCQFAFFNYFFYMLKEMEERQKQQLSTFTVYWYNVFVNMNKGERRHGPPRWMILFSLTINITKIYGLLGYHYFT